MICAPGNPWNEQSSGESQTPWQLKMSGSFSRELDQHSYDQVASLVAFGKTSISACNDSHSSQATSTLGNTPNLNIGFLRRETST